MKISLQSRILLPTAALVLTLTLASGILSYRQTANALEESVDNQMRALTHGTVEKIELWIHGQEQLLGTLAQETTLSALLDDPGQTGLRTNYDQQLQALKKQLGCYESLHLADSQGLVRCSSEPSQIDHLNIQDRAYFKASLAGQPQVSDALLSRISGQPAVVVSVPVRSGDRVTGVLLGVLDLDWFAQRFTKDVKVLQTGYLFVHDKTGAVVAHPDKEKILKLKLADLDWAKPMLAEKSGMIDYTFDGVAKSAIFQKSETLGWGVVGTVPISEATAGAKHLLITNAIVGVSFLGIGIVVVLLVTRGITRPVRRITGVLAAGADQTAVAAGHVAAVSLSASEGASEQAASLEETSSSLEELNSMVRRNGESTQKAGELARSAREAADHGAEEMRRMTAALEEISGAGDEVGKIARSINEIAFQTNILALNAAVEAARAGEAGLGFAVVADEVRSLAQRSAGAARESAERIETALAKTAIGRELGSKVDKRLELIVTKVRAMDELMSEITTASAEQTQGIQQITTAVSQMDQVTQRNVASSEEGASAAEELNAQADQLRKVTQELETLVDGHAASGSRKASPPKIEKTEPAPKGKASGVVVRPAIPRLSTATAVHHTPVVLPTPSRSTTPASEMLTDDTF